MILFENGTIKIQKLYDIEEVNYDEISQNKNIKIISLQSPVNLGDILNDIENKGLIKKEDIEKIPIIYTKEDEDTYKTLTTEKAKNRFNTIKRLLGNFCRSETHAFYHSSPDYWSDCRPRFLQYTGLCGSNKPYGWYDAFFFCEKCLLQFYDKGGRNYD